MLSYVNALDKGLNSLLDSLNDFNKLKKVVGEEFGAPVVEAIEHDYSRGEIVDMKLFKLKNNVTIDINTVVNKGHINIFINSPEWDYTLAAEWQGIKLKFDKIIKL